MTTVAPTPPGLAPAPKPTPEREKLAAAARQFEAIFVRQMLASARAAKLDSGENALFGGQAMETFQSMQDERFAQIAADRGAFGLAAAIERQLAAQIGDGSARASTGSARAEPGASPTPGPGTTTAQPELVEGRARPATPTGVR